MSQLWRTENLFILLALCMIVIFGVCYLVPNLHGVFSYVSTTFFLLSGIATTALGCFGFYYLHKHSW